MQGRWALRRWAAPTFQIIILIESIDNWFKYELSCYWLQVIDHVVKCLVVGNIYGYMFG